MFVPTEQKVITPKSITNTPTICKIFPRFGLRMVTSSCLTGWCDTELRLVPQNWQKRDWSSMERPQSGQNMPGDHSGERSTISVYTVALRSRSNPRNKHELAVRRASSPQMATCSIINASAVARPVHQAHTGRQRWQRFRPRCRRMEFANTDFNGSKPRRQRVAGLVDRLPQVLGQGVGLLVGESRVSSRRRWLRSGKAGSHL